MSVFLVTWEINKAKSTYNEVRTKFLAKVGEYQYVKDSGLDSVIFLAATQPASTISENLRIALDNDDRLVVTKMNLNEYAGWLKSEIWEWIRSRV